MPFSIPEVLADIPELLGLVQKIEEQIKSLPATGRKAADYGKIIVAVVPDLTALIDTIESQAAS